MMKPAIMLLALACAAHAQGLLIPAEADLPPLAMRTHNVVVEVDRQAAVTRVEQVFENNTDQALEATYVFPVPKGAVMSSFSLEANGVATRGELVDRDEAQHLYKLGVQDARSPARLDQSHDGAFKAVVYPVPAHGVQTIKLTFTHLVPRDGGLFWYEYPVPEGNAALAGSAYAFHLEGRVRASLPIKTVYSPTHPVAVDRPGPLEARFRLDATTPPDRTLKIACTVSDQDVGIDLIAHRPVAGEPGYFMLLVSPGTARSQARRMPRDVVLVMDRSGSMAGEKIEQARKALRYCVDNLADEDRFDIVTFSTEAEHWRGRLASAKTDRAAARAWIDAIQPDGGTNVAAALERAYQYPREPGRQAVVLFFTDGKPTLGDTTDPGRLLSFVEGRPRARVFTWGLGHDLDRAFLERLAGDNGGVPEFVEPGEDLAAKVEAFHRKSAHPVLEDLSLSVEGGVQLVASYPRRLPELYAGGVLAVVGRYRGDGAAKLTLRGRMGGAAETFAADVQFPALSAAHPFIAPLWARPHIGRLLDAIREHGERRELVEKVVALSTQHGVSTPYTSFLIRDAGVVVTARPVDRMVLASTGPVPAGFWAMACALTARAREGREPGLICYN